ncbi:MAG: hypothetical protein KDK70_28310, partial [Myxococcales bacterium]|nr:hypothetical protein [Myxococcales bacterium]
ADLEYRREGKQIEVLPLPAGIDVGSPYFVREGDGERWRKGPPLERDPATGNLRIPVGLEAVVRKSVLQGTPLELLLVVDGQPRLATIAHKEEEPEPEPDPDPTGAGSGGFDFEAACEAELAALMRPEDPPRASRPPGSTERQRQRQQSREHRRKRDRGVRQEWEYLVCIDFTEVKNPRVRVHTTRPGVDPEAEQGGAHLFAGRDVVLRAWHRKGVGLEATLGGTVGFRSFTYVPDFEAFRGQGAGPKGADTRPPVDPTPYGKRFSGRKADDQPVTLTVAASATQGTGKDAQQIRVAELQHPFRVTDVYLGALRLSVAGTWAPWDRRYGTATSTTPQNPGEEVVITDGADLGLANLELLAGYTVFFTPVYHGERTVTAGSYFGLGVLGTDTAKGLDALTSGHVGLELAVGRDFGIALDFSLRRTQKLRGDLDVGSPVEGRDIDRLGITPAFGVVLNLSPRFWKAVGAARKGVL